MVELREETNLSQKQAAARAGMTRRNWLRLEHGENSPRLDSLLSVQYALGVDSLEALFHPVTGDILGRDDLPREPS